MSYKKELFFIMTIREKYIAAIREERKAASRDGIQKVHAGLERGEVGTVRSYLLFHADRENWDDELGTLLKGLSRHIEERDYQAKRVGLSELAGLAIDLLSFLPMWYLKPDVSDEVLRKGSEQVQDLLRELATRYAQSASEVHEGIIRRSRKRFAAEAVADDELEDEVQKLCGSSLPEYVTRMIAQLHSSNLLETARLFREAGSPTVLGNDYGDFLEETLWMGTSYVTTNPPLINLAWNTEPEFWDGELEAYTRENHIDGGSEGAVTTLCRAATMLVVERNCRHLRDIFLLTEGKQGYCCYQVNPNNHNHADGMVEEVTAVYGLLEERLGGVPNVSFKLPGTPASVEAARTLSARGVSLTITLEFGLFQAVEFAKVFSAGEAITSNVVVMNGRLAFPVRDELIANGIEGGSEASKLAGVEVSRHLYRTLYEGGLGIDPQRVRIMNASLRIYGSDIPDLIELWGFPLITIFPNVRRVYDAVPREITIDRTAGETPADVMAVLHESEIFRQAWWIEGDAPDTRPTQLLVLSDEMESQVVSWGPITATLDQFLGSYAELETRVKRIIAGMKKEETA